MKAILQGQEAWRIPMKMVSNSNLIINWDFRKPVNRNGKMEYVASTYGKRYAIDKFETGLSLYILDGYVRVLNNVKAESAWFYQYYVEKSDIKSYIGQTLTLSILVRSDTNKVNLCAALTATAINIPLQITDDFTLVTIKCKITDVRDDPYIGLVAHNGLTGNETIDLIAVKLEVGETQTLAHKESDHWVINDSIDYDLQYALCSQYSSINGKWIGNQHSNRNLLRNWNFRKPVNRKGQTEYIGSNPAIDGWRGTANIVRIRVIEGGIILDRAPTATATNSKNMGQSIPDFDTLRGKTVTLSALVSDCTATPQIVFQPITGGSSLLNIAGVVSTKLQLITATFTIPTDGPEVEVWLRASGSSVNTYATFVAAKLELGEQQTLARQDENGEWEIIDPPDYDLQYLKCLPYSPMTGKFVGVNYSNPTLLDNGYLIDPVNQRGETEYDATNANVHVCDRWYAKGGMITITSDGLGMSYLSGGIGSCWMQQNIDINDMFGRNVVLSALIDDGELISYSTTIPTTANTSNTLQGITTKSGATIWLRVTNLNNTRFSVVILLISPNTSILVKAVKLELGSIQTLAHREGDTWVLNDPPPNKALESLKCQRYLLRVNYPAIMVGRTWSNDPEKATIFIPTPVSFRAAPSTVTDVSGICYFNDGSLMRLENTTISSFKRLGNGCSGALSIPGNTKKSLSFILEISVDFYLNSEL